MTGLKDTINKIFSIDGITKNFQLSSLDLDALKNVAPRKAMKYTNHQLHTICRSETNSTTNHNLYQANKIKRLRCSSRKVQRMEPPRTRRLRPAPAPAAIHVTFDDVRGAADNENHNNTTDMSIPQERRDISANIATSINQIMDKSLDHNKYSSIDLTVADEMEPFGLAGDPSHILDLCKTTNELSIDKNNQCDIIAQLLEKEVAAPNISELETIAPILLDQHFEIPSINSAIEVIPTEQNISHEEKLPQNAIPENAAPQLSSDATKTSSSNASSKLSIIPKRIRLRKDEIDHNHLNREIKKRLLRFNPRVTSARMDDWMLVRNVVWSSIDRFIESIRSNEQQTFENPEFPTYSKEANITDNIPLERQEKTIPELEISPILQQEKNVSAKPMPSLTIENVKLSERMTELSELLKHPPIEGQEEWLPRNVPEHNIVEPEIMMPMEHPINILNVPEEIDAELIPVPASLGKEKEIVSRLNSMLVCSMLVLKIVYR